MSDELAGAVLDALSWLCSLDAPQFVRVFWATLFLDLPRYGLAYLLVLYMHLRDLGRPRVFASRTAPPLMSVVVAALNEAETIGPSLRSVLEQDYPNLEVIVVDDGSTDRTWEIAAGFARDRRVRVHRFAERQGKSAAMNFALTRARGEYVVYMDSDSTLDRDALAKLARRFEDPRVGAVSGDLGVRNRTAGLLTRFQAIEYLIALSLGRRFKALAGILAIVPGALGAFRRSLLERVGAKDPGPSDDSDVTIRTRKLGRDIAFAGDAVCLTTVPSTWRRWLKQRMRWDRGIVRMKVHKHGDAFDLRSANFRLSTSISFADVIFFSALLPAGWLIYFMDLLISYPQAYLYVLIAVLLMRTGLTLAGVGIGVLVTGRRFDAVDVLIAVPLFSFYSTLLKAVRVTAMLQELLFRSSYRDPFAPEKVRANAQVF